MRFWVEGDVVGVGVAVEVGVAVGVVVAVGVGVIEADGETVLGVALDTREYVSVRSQPGL